MEISALTFGSRTVAVPLINVRAGDDQPMQRQGNSPGYERTASATASAASAMTHHT